MKPEENEFMQHELRLPELTFRGMLLGAILTVIFTAANVYLGLKVGHLPAVYIRSGFG